MTNILLRATSQSTDYQFDEGHSYFDSQPDKLNCARLTNPLCMLNCILYFLELD